MRRCRRPLAWMTTAEPRFDAFSPSPALVVEPQHRRGVGPTSSANRVANRLVIGRHASGDPTFAARSCDSYRHWRWPGIPARRARSASSGELGRGASAGVPVPHSVAAHAAPGIAARIANSIAYEAINSIERVAPPVHPLAIDDLATKPSWPAERNLVDRGRGDRRCPAGPRDGLLSLRSGRGRGWWPRDAPGPLPSHAGCVARGHASGPTAGSWLDRRPSSRGFPHSDAPHSRSSSSVRPLLQSLASV